MHFERPETAMNLEVETINKNVVIRVSGRLDMNTSPALRKAALRLYTKSECKNLIVDFTEVSFIDTSALATLIEILVAAKEQCAQLTLCGLNENVRYLIEVNGLTEFFRIESSTREELLA
jgi:anti-anti-sigma factor